MWAGRSITAALLSEYAFVDHVFSYIDDECTTDQIKRSLAFYARYGMRILRVCLPCKWNEPLLDAETGRSVLPASLIALTIGGVDDTAEDLDHREERRCVAFAEFVDGGGWRGREEAEVWGDGDEQIERCVRQWEEEEDDSCYTWDLFEYASCIGHFNQLIPPGALPASLRYLQLGNAFDQPLEVGSIPDSVELLQFNSTLAEPLEAGHLPASLTHFVFHGHYNHPLQPGALSAGLRRVYLSSGFDDPLLPGVLPSQLRALHLGHNYDHPLPPGAIPATVTHLRLSNRFNQPLQVGSIPHGVSIFTSAIISNTHCCQAHCPPLSVSLLSATVQPALLPGALPDGLQLLAFPTDSLCQPLRPGVILASMRARSMGCMYKQLLAAGGIPATVQWLPLPHVEVSGELVQGVLSSTTATEVVKWYWKL